MSLRYLLDTNIISNPFLGTPHPQVLANIKAHAAQIAICAPVWHELLFGYHRLPRSVLKTDLDRYLQDFVLKFPVLPYDDRAARWHAEERARLYKKTPSMVDGLVAAVAAANGLIVVTRNVEHFKPYGVPIENWMA